MADGNGGAGAAASTLNPVGGDGRASDITCNDGEAPVWYAGGGGGGYSDKSFTGLHDPIAGGKGGGGAGGYGANVACTDATFYGGGGGGGGAVGTNATTPGGNGYQGVVYVRISIATSGAIVKPTNQTVAFDGTEHVLVAASPAYVITDLTEGSPTYGQIVSRVAATDCGTCKAKVELVDGFKWSDGTKTVETVTLTINRATPVISDLRIRDWIAGTPDSATPNPSCRVSIAVEPTYEYGDSATGPWSAEKPTAVGTHYLRASIAETANCNAAESVSPFTIFNGPGDIYRDHVEITIGAASSPMSEFVYELRLSEGAPVGFLYERAGETGEDLTITDANGVALDYTVGTWNTAGESRLYVKLPELSTSPQVIRLFWCVREGKTPPSHTACGIPSGDPQPSFDFDLVERAGKPISKTKWDSIVESPATVTSYGTIKEGTPSLLYVTNLNTGAVSPGITSVGGSFSAVFGPYDPVGDYEPFEYGIDVLVVGHGVGYGGGAGIGGGCWGNGGVIVINGGDVLAGGGGSGAGIGGGYGGGAGGEVTISGGMVMGGGFNGGAGIGGGLDGSGGNVTITGGDAVSALSNSGGCAGIGGGAGGIGGTVTIKPTVGIAIQVEAGADAGSAAPVAGSPFAMETDVTSLLAGNLFVHVGKAFAEGDIALTDYAGTYDGLAHTIGIATNAIPGLALRYSSSSSPSSPPSPSTTLPLFTNVTNVTVSVEASAPGYITFTTNATVTIAPRMVTLTSGSAEKVYDGTPVTCADVVVGSDGFLTSEGATYDVTGSQTHVGVGTNTFTYVLNAGTFAINYAIVTSNGTLTVTKATNAWTTEPSISGWTYGEAAGVPQMGEAKFGTVAVSYGASGTELPSVAGDYVATFTVEGTADYSGLTKEVPFTIEPEPTPDPEPDGGGEELPTKDEVFAGAVDTQFAAGQELLGTLYDADGNVVGTVTLKFGKRNRRTGKVKLTASATIIVDGAVKKVGAKAVRFKADEWAAERMIEFKQPIGSMALASEGERFTLRNESYMMKGLAVDAKSGAERDVKVGGSLLGKAMRFRMEIGSLPTLSGGYAFVPSSFPADVTMNVAGVRRVVSGRASARKVTLEYVIRGLDAAISSKLKLKYAPKTGLFKGSFKVYATAGGDKPKRRSYTVKVVGYVVDGVGVGQAALKKPSAKWPITLE